MLRIPSVATPAEVWPDEAGLTSTQMIHRSGDVGAFTKRERDVTPLLAMPQVPLCQPGGCSLRICGSGSCGDSQYVRIRLCANATVSQRVKLGRVTWSSEGVNVGTRDR